MTKEACWAEPIFNGNYELTLLKFKGDARMYMTRKWDVSRDRITHFAKATYHVWSNDKEVLATTDYLEAIGKWRDEVGQFS